MEAATGAPASLFVNSFLRAVVARDVEVGLSILAKSVERGVEEKVFLDLLLRKMRAVIMLRFVAGSAKRLAGDFADEDMALIEDLAKNATHTLTSKELTEFLRAYESVRVAWVPGLALELALLRISGK